MPDPEPLLRVTDLSLTEAGQPVLHPLSFEQRQGQRLALAGASGAGKSTLLQLVAGLVQPSTGEIRINGRRVMRPADALVPGHPGVAYLSQRSELPRFLRVEQVLRYASQRPPAEAQALLALCRIDHLLSRQTSQLSGGEQQRVALARLLLGAPRLLLLDEPFSNLDRAHKRTMQQIIEEVGTRLGITCLLVSHEATDTLPWADELLLLRQGQLVQQGPPAQLYHQPADEYAAGLLGDYSLLLPPDWPTLAAGQALLLRPEQLQLAALDAPAALAGTVRAVRFLGGFYEVEIRLKASILRLHVAQPTPVPSQAAGVAVVGEGWVVQR